MSNTEALRAAAEQALEAMNYSGMDVGKFNRINAACRALREALSESTHAADVSKSGAGTNMSAPAVPAGWVLVPVEPTDAMQIAGALAHESSFAHDFIGPIDDVWAAMLAAAPDAQKGEP